MRKGVLYESVKRFVKTRKEDLNAFFTTSLRMRKFEISCCDVPMKLKNNCYLFERLFRVKKNGAFLFGISFLVLEIFTFFYYANEESDDVIGGST